MTVLFSKEAQNNLATFLGSNYEIQASEHYGSNNTNHRQLIREDVIQKVGQTWSISQQKSFLDLTQVPNPPVGYVSISHTTDCGIWIYGSNAVGIDLELTQKISDKTVARISNKNEIAHTQDLVSNLAPLWTAKEAAFKLMSATVAIKVLSQIEISWLEKNSLSQNEMIFLFQTQADNKNCCKGFTVLNELYCVSVAIFSGSHFHS